MCCVRYFTESEVETFLHGDTSDMDDYLRILNVAHDLPAAEALAAIEELLEYAASEMDIARIAAGALEQLVQLYPRALGSSFDAALVRNAKLREAYVGVYTTGVPLELARRWDALCASELGRAE